MNKNAAIASIVLLLSGCLSASCGTGDGSGAAGAERQLERTLSAVKGKKLPYDSSSEVKIAGTTMQNVSGRSAGNNAGNTEWDPLESLKLLESVGRTADFEAVQADDGNVRSLRVEVDQADWKRAVETHFRQQLSGKKAEEDALVNSNRSRLPPEQAASLEKELLYSISQAENRLNGILPTLKTKGTYRIIVDKMTHMPKKMTVVNAMQYEDGDKQQEETVISTYVFH